MKTVFQRIEKKYLLDAVTCRALLLRIRDQLTPDAYPRYTVSSIYYDTPDWLLARRSIEQPPFKEKLRLRGYGVPASNDTVFLELKRKVDGVVYKRREAMTLAEAERYCKTGRHSGSSQIWNELEYFQNLYRTEPRVYLAYDRRAFTGKEDSALRLTLDTNIRYRTASLRLGAGDWGNQFMREEDYLMEIKADGAMPLWLSHALCDLSIFPTSFSKYGVVYKNALCGQRSVLACV